MSADLSRGSAHDTYTSRLQADAELIGQRWAAAIIYVLLEGPQRFNDLLRAIPGISDRMLTERLRALAEAGIVYRDVRVPATFGPVRIAYGLTRAGHDLRPVLLALENWRDRRLEEALRQSGGVPVEPQP